MPPAAGMAQGHMGAEQRCCAWWDAGCQLGLGKKTSSILCLQLSLCLLLPAAAFKPSRAPSPITTLQ